MIVRPVDVLAAARPLIPEAMVSPDAWKKILPLAEEMPDASCIQYLECRLAQDDERVDYQIVGRLPGVTQILELAADLEHRRRHPGCERIAAFARRLRHDRGLRRFVPSAGLEFDIPDGGAGSLPQVGFCVDPRLFRDLTHEAPPPSTRAFLQPIVRALTALRGEPLSGATVRALARCFRSLPPRSRVMHVAALIGRAGGGVRFIPRLPVARVARYLRRVGWGGDPRLAASVLPLCRPDGKFIKIDVDVEERIMPKFAAFAEYTIADEMLTEPTYALTRPFLDALVARRLCGPKKRDALVAWPARVPLVLRGLALPARLSLHLDFKVVAWPDGRLEAKTYLGLLPGFTLI